MAITIREALVRGGQRHENPHPPHPLARRRRALSGADAVAALRGVGDGADAAADAKIKNFALLKSNIGSLNNCMSVEQFSTNTKSAIIEWRMAICWFVLFSTVSLAAATMGALTNANWSTMDGQGKFQMLLAIFVSWGTTMMAFFSKAAKKVENEILPEGGSSIQTVQTTQTDTQSVKVTTKPLE